MTADPSWEGGLPHEDSWAMDRVVHRRLFPLPQWVAATSVGSGSGCVRQPVP